MGRKGCNMTPLLGRGGEGGLAIFLFVKKKKMLIVVYEYLTQSKYINETQTKQEQRPTRRGTTFNRKLNGVL